MDTRESEALQRRFGVMLTGTSVIGRQLSERIHKNETERLVELRSRRGFFSDAKS